MKFFKMVLLVILFVVVGCQAQEDTSQYTFQIQTNQIKVIYGNGQELHIEDKDAVSMITTNLNENTYHSLSSPEQVGGFTLYFDDGWKYSSQGYIEKDNKKYRTDDQNAIEHINNYVVNKQ